MVFHLATHVLFGDPYHQAGHSSVSLAPLTTRSARRSPLTPAVNRLDRLTSGLMILALSGPASNELAKEFRDGKVGKEYIARVKGKFPEGEITVDQPLLTVDRQMGLVIVAPEGKVSREARRRGAPTRRACAKTWRWRHR